ncbi:MAG: hypothetical protein AB1295_04100 [Candidatus Micrarchaeota archaeon]
MSEPKSRFFGRFTRRGAEPPKPAQAQPPSQSPIQEILGSLKSGAPKSDGPAKTTFMDLEQLTGSVAVPQTSSKLLAKLKEQVSQLRVIDHRSVINTSRDHAGDEVYHPLPERIIGASIIKTNAATFLIGRTRSTWFALYDTPHETLHDREPQLMEADLKKRDKSLTPAGKVMYLSSIRTQDLRVLQNISARDAMCSGKAQSADTLSPQDGVFSFEETRSRLMKCALMHCTDVYFDPVVFTAQILFMTPTQGDQGSYYYLQSGNPDNPRECELHIGKDPKHPEGSYKHKASLMHGRELCFLYIDVNY